MRKIEISNDRLLRQVRSLANELGRAPTMKEFDECPKTASSYLAVRQFGTWRNFLKAAGMTGYRKHPNGSIILQLRELERELGRRPTMKEFDKCPHTASISAVRAQFGSWTKLLKAAGFKVDDVREYSDKELIEQLLDLTDRLGHVPTLLEFDIEPETVSRSTIQNRFGSWKAFLEVAGVKTR